MNNITITRLTEEVERLLGDNDRIAHELREMVGVWITAEADYQGTIRLFKGEVASLTAEVEEQRARRRVWQQRTLKAWHVLAGTDWAALPSDYPIEKMAQDRMDDIARLTARVAELEEVLDRARMWIERDEAAHGRTFGTGNAIRAALSASQPAPQEKPNERI